MVCVCASWGPLRREVPYKKAASNTHPPAPPVPEHFVSIANFHKVSRLRHPISQQERRSCTFVQVLVRRTLPRREHRF